MATTKGYPAGGRRRPGAPGGDPAAAGAGALDTRTRTDRAGWLLIAPALAVLLAMTIFPAGYLLYNSFRRYNLMQPQTGAWVGLGNYRSLVVNGDLRHGLITTLIFVGLAVGVELVIGLALAVILAPERRENSIASAILILPMAVTPVVSALIWRQLFDPNLGWIDYYLQRIGIIDRPIEWLSGTRTAWFTLVSLDVWQWTPFVALILMAGLQGIPTEPREAAAIDGAQGWRLFWDITLPQLRPFIAIAVLLRVLEAFKTFGTVKVLTGGGPGTSTEIINLAIYRTALQDFSVGAAAALGISFLVFLSIVVPQMLRMLARNTDILEE